MHVFSAKISETMTEANFQRRSSCFFKQGSALYFVRLEFTDLKKIILSMTRDETMLEVLYSNLLVYNQIDGYLENRLVSKSKNPRADERRPVKRFL